MQQYLRMNSGTWLRAMDKRFCATRAAVVVVIAHATRALPRSAPPTVPRTTVWMRASVAVSISMPGTKLLMMSLGWLVLEKENLEPAHEATFVRRLDSKGVIGSCTTDCFSKG